VDPRAGLDGCRKSCPHQDLIPGPSSLYRVAIMNVLSWVTSLKSRAINNRHIITHYCINSDRLKQTVNREKLHVAPRLY